MRTSLVARGMAAVMAVTGLGMVTLPTASAAPVLEGDGCTVYGSVPDAPKGYVPRDDLMTQTRDPLAKWVSEHRRQIARAQAADTAVTVPVAFHVIRKNGTLQGGNVPQQWITRQMDVLNDSFGGRTDEDAADTNFKFVLEDVDRTTKPQWFTLFYAQGGEPRFYRGGHKEIKMKKALHQGGADTLNVYTAKLGKFLLGWAYYPSSFVGDTALPRFYDGVVIDYRTLPQTQYVWPYNGGDTLTHEVGHWMNLAHTFANGCTRPGDFVADTPYEASPAFRCPKGRDTCEQPGVDPIENFMDYTDDECLHEFTEGQASRMQKSWTAYRQ
jgi:hypothetical protein